MAEKSYGRNGVAEDILGPSQDAGRRHVDFARNQSEIATFARPKHQPMGAQTDRRAGDGVLVP